MNDNTKKTLLIIALIGIVVILGLLAFSVLNKKGDLGTKKTTNTSNDDNKVNVIDTEDSVKLNRKTSALGYVDAVQQQAIANREDASIPEIKEGTYESDSLKLLKVDFPGENPTMGVITINAEGIVTAAWLEFAEDKIYFNGEKAELVKEFPDKTTANCVVNDDNGTITNSCN